MISKIGATTNSLSFGRKVTVSEKPKEPKSITFDTKKLSFGVDEDGVVKIVDLSENPYKAYLVPGVPFRQVLDLYNNEGDDAQVTCDSIEETVA